MTIDRICHWPSAPDRRGSIDCAWYAPSSSVVLSVPHFLRRARPDAHPPATDTAQLCSSLAVSISHDAVCRGAAHLRSLARWARLLGRCAIQAMFHLPEVDV